MPVTAQDFLDSIYRAGPGNVTDVRFHHAKAWEEDLKPLWDYLISRIRQEERERYHEISKKEAEENAKEHDEIISELTDPNL